jgi:DNA-binding FadR family transcriptional regulator
MARLLADDIARSLKVRIESGEWSDGHRIPAERDLALDFGVARNTVRRAMDRLREEGAISRHVGRGTFVSADGRPTLASIVARMEGASPADMMEVRLLIEPAAAAFAATNASAAELAAVEEAHRAACAADHLAAFEQWDAELHHRIFACSRNDLLREIHALMRSLRNRGPWFEMKRRSFSEERRLRYCAEHAAVAAALRQRHPEGARTAMATHLRTVAANMLGR